MGILDWLLNIDTQLMLYLNSFHSDFFDVVMTIWTGKEPWFILYAVIAYQFIRRYKTDGIIVLVFCVLSIVLSDQISTFMKNSIMRPRPSHAVDLQGLLNLPIGKRGAYGFVSSHSTNAFALATFTSLVFRNKLFNAFIFAWALIIAYSRIYVGVHYPLDITCGGLLGVFLGWFSFRLLDFTDQRFLSSRVRHWKGDGDNSLNQIQLVLVLTFVLAFASAKVLLKYGLVT